MFQIANCRCDIVGVSYSETKPPDIKLVGSHIRLLRLQQSTIFFFTTAPRSQLPSIPMIQKIPKRSHFQAHRGACRWCPCSRHYLQRVQTKQRVQLESWGWRGGKGFSTGESVHKQEGNAYHSVKWPRSTELFARCRRLASSLCLGSPIQPVTQTIPQ